MSESTCWAIWQASEGEPWEGAIFGGGDECDRPEVGDRDRAETTYPPMTTKSSPGRLAHDCTRELCMQSSVPGTAPELAAFAGYWNSPAAHTTYRAASVSVAPAGPVRRLPGSLGLEAAEIPTLKSGGPPFTPSAWTETTSVCVRTHSLASLASALR